MCIRDSSSPPIIHIEDNGMEFPAAPEQSVLHGMSRLGRKGIPTGCYGGGCGVCRIQVLAGEYHTAKMSRDQVSAQDEAEGIALSCRTFADSDLRIRVLGKMRRAVLRDRPRR